MTKRRTLLASIVAVLALLFTITPVLAYFSTYVRVPGEKPVQLGEKVRIKEDGEEFKHVVLTADEDSDPVFVRIAVYAPKEIEKVLTIEGENWKKNGEYYEYELPLHGGESAEITIKIPDGTEINRDTFDVVVLYEYVPALMDADGKLYADWTFKPVIEKIGG